MTVEDVAVIGGYPPISAGRGGDIEALRVTVIDPQAAIVAANPGSHLHTRWLRVGPVPSNQSAVAAADGANVEVEDVVGLGASASQALVYGQATSTLTLTRGAFAGAPAFVLEGEASVSDVHSRGGAYQLEVRGAEAHVALARMDMSGGDGTRVNIRTQASVTATDIVIRDVGPPVAYGFFVVDASLDLERASIERAQVGIYAWRTAHVHVVDAAIRDLTTVENDQVTAGLIAVDGSDLTARRVSVERVEGYGVYAFMTGSSLRLEDVSIREVHGPPGSTLGIGVQADSAPSSLMRVEITGIAEIGAAFGARTTVEDLSIQDITPGADGVLGVGLAVSAGPTSAPTVTGARVAIRDVASVGLGVSGAMAGDPAGRVSLALTDLRIERAGTAASGGAGVTASGDAMTSLTRFVVRDAASVGVISGTGATLTLTDGLVTTTTTCTSSELPLDLTTVRTDACGSAPVTWMPPSR